MDRARRNFHDPVPGDVPRTQRQRPDGGAQGLDGNIRPGALHRACGNHPLLMGYIFGSGSILLARRVYLARAALERVLMAIGVLGSWVIVLAASSRSATIALMVALGAAGRFPRTHGKAHRWWRPPSAFWGWRSGLGTISHALDSAYRGFGTGATGRTDLWRQGLESFIADSIAFGGGLRLEHDRSAHRELLHHDIARQRHPHRVGAYLVHAIHTGACAADGHAPAAELDAGAGLNTHAGLEECPRALSTCPDSSSQLLHRHRKSHLMTLPRWCRCRYLTAQRVERVTGPVHAKPLSLFVRAKI